MKYNLLASVMRVQTSSYKTERMSAFIIKHLHKHKLGFTKDKYGNIYVTKGHADLYPTMVCHIDTVHGINDNVRVMKSGDKMFTIDSTNCHRIGIGGDDKVGIYITLQCLEKFDNFKAVFFLDEEVGCKGSSQADFEFFDDSTIVLECDRRGYGDFVNNISGIKLCDDTLIDDIQSILTNYKYKTCNGGITDVGEIAENTKVQVANMSCGYYEPHTDDEYIVISEVELVYKMCVEILTITDGKAYRIEDDRISYTGYGGYGGYDWNYGWNGHNRKIGSYNNGFGTAAYTQEEIEEDAFLHPISETCNHCCFDQLIYDEYEDSYYCNNCQMYLTEQDVDKIYNSFEEYENNNKNNSQ